MGSADDILAAGAIVFALVAILLSIYEWNQLLLARKQRQLTREALNRLEGKVERLGASMIALKSAIESRVQKLQLDDLVRQVAVSTAEIKHQIDMVDGLQAAPARAGPPEALPVGSARTVVVPNLTPDARAGSAAVQRRGISGSFGRLRNRLQGR